LKGTTGEVDTAFGPSGDGIFSLPFATNVSPKTAAILPDGKAIVTGYTNANGGNKPILFKLTTAGALDPSFAAGGVYFPENGVDGFGTGGVAESYAALLQGDKIVTTGYGKENGTQAANGWLSLRLLANGTIDPTYGTNGHVYIPINGQAAQSRGLTILSDQRPVMVGGASPIKPSADAGTQSQYAGVAILQANGALDPSNPQAPRLYDLGGPATGRAAHFFWGAAESPDKKQIALVGIKGSITANADAGVAGGTDEAAFLLLPTGH
jgi:uncharacterized delta-60 repeat protein